MGGFFTDRTKTLDVIGPSGGEFTSSAEQFVGRTIGKKTGMYPYLGEFIDPDVPSSYKIKTSTIPWSSKHLGIKKIYHKNGVSVKTVPTYHGPFPSVGYRVELAGCVISFTGDMSGRLNAMPKLAKDSDILIAHNAIPENATGIATNLHMTPSYIGKMTREANIKKLLLTHMMKRSISVKPETQKIIEKLYKGEIVFPNDLDVFNP